MTELKEEGNKHFQQKYYIIAIQKYRAAVSFYNENKVSSNLQSSVILHSNICETYLRLRDFEKAYKEAKIALEIDPTHEKSKNRLERANKCVRELLENDIFKVLMDEANFHLNNKNSLNAIEVYSYILSRNPPKDIKIEILTKRSLCYLDTQQNKASKRDILHALTENPQEELYNLFQFITNAPYVEKDFSEEIIKNEDQFSLNSLFFNYIKLQKNENEIRENELLETYNQHYSSLFQLLINIKNTFVVSTTIVHKKILNIKELSAHENFKQFTKIWEKKLIFVINLLTSTIPTLQLISGEIFNDIKRWVFNYLQTLMESFFTFGPNSPAAAIDLEAERLLSISSPIHTFQLGMIISQLNTQNILITNSLNNVLRLINNINNDYQLLLKEMENFKEQMDLAIINMNRDLEIKFPEEFTSPSSSNSPLDLYSRFISGTTAYFIGLYINIKAKDRLFLSHFGKDSKIDLTHTIKYSNERHLCFLDCLNISNGESCKRFIIENLITSSDCIFFLTDRFSQSEYCREEIIVWNFVRSIRNLHYPQYSNRTFFWIAGKGGDDVFNQIKAARLFDSYQSDDKIDVQYFDTKDDFKKNLLSLVNKCYPNIIPQPNSIFNKNSIGLLRRSQSMIEWKEWGDLGCSSISFFSTLIMCFELYENILRSISLSDFEILLSKMDTLNPELFSGLTSIRSAAANGISIILQQVNKLQVKTAIRIMSKFSEIQQLISFISSTLVHTIDYLSEIINSVLLYPKDAVPLGNILSGKYNNIYALSLSFLICSMERMRDVCDILMGKKEREEAWFLTTEDNQLKDNDLEYHVMNAIDNAIDAKCIFHSLDNVLSICSLLNTDQWTYYQWISLCLGIQEQRRFRRRIIVNSGGPDTAVPLIMASREIIYISDTIDRCFLNESVLLLFLLNLNSRTIIITQHKEDESGLLAQFGSLKLGDIPHFTLNNIIEILWLFVKSDRVADEIKRISEEVKCDVSRIADGFLQLYSENDKDQISLDIDNRIRDYIKTLPTYENVVVDHKNTNFSYCIVVEK